MRALKWTGYIGVLLISIASVAVLMLFTTVAGVGVALNVATRLVPGLSVHGWSGSLTRNICVQELNYRNNRLEIDAETLCVNFNLWDSLDTLEVSMKSLNAAAINVHRLPGAPPADPAAGYVPPLPVAISVDTLLVTDFSYEDFALSAIEGSAALDADQTELDVSFDYSAYSFDLQAQGSWNALAVDAVLWLPQQVSLRGEFNLTRPELPYHASLKAADLDLRSWTPRALQLQQSRLELNGDLHRYDYQLDTLASDVAIGHARITSTGSGDTTGLSLSSEVELSPNAAFINDLQQLTLSGSISWSPEVRFELQADTTAVTAQFPGMLMTLGGAVALAGTPADLAINATALRGVFNQYPLSGSASLRWRNSMALIDRVALQLGDGQLTVTGSVDTAQSTQLHAEGNAVPLGIISPQLRGDITGTLDLAGYPQAPSLTLSIRTRDAGIGNFDSRTLAVDYTGTLRAGRAQATLEHKLGHADGRFALALQQDFVSADIDSLNASYSSESGEETVRLALLKPTHLRYASGSLIVDQACFNAFHSDHPSRPANACLALRYPEGPADLTLADLQLPVIQLPTGNLGVEGTVNAQVQISSFEHPEGTAQVEFSRLITHIEEVSREIGDLSLALNMNEQQARVRISSPQQQALVSSGEITANLVPEFLQSAISGNVSVSVEGIRLIREFLPMDVAYEISDLTGQLEVTAELAGTLQAPLIDGGIKVLDAGWQLNISGSRFRNVEMTAMLEDTSTLDLAVTGGLGKGTFQVDGALTDLGGETAQLKSRIRFDAAEVLDLPDYTASLSGDLDLALTSATISLNGDLEMPKAEIVIAELPETAIAVSRDTIIVGTSETRTNQQLRTTNIKLKLGKDVHLTAFGLDTDLRGSLTLIETPGKPPDLRGVVTLRNGIFEAYGQKLKVTRGELTFIGPVDDPVLNLTASRTIQRSSGDVVVSIVLSGTAKAIETQVRSDPALPEGDALALLLTGRTLSEMTSGEQTNVYGAAIALGLYGASGVTRSLAATMGLEEIIVGQDNQGAWEVGAAVRLQEDLYLRYTYGVFSRLGGVLLRYRLSDRFSVQAKAGDTQSIEIRYGVE